MPIAWAILEPLAACHPRSVLLHRTTSRQFARSNLPKLATFDRQRSGGGNLSRYERHTAGRTEVGDAPCAGLYVLSALAYARHFWTAQASTYRATTGIVRDLFCNAKGEEHHGTEI